MPRKQAERSKDGEEKTKEKCYFKQTDIKSNNKPQDESKSAGLSYVKATAMDNPQKSSRAFIITNAEKYLTPNELCEIAKAIGSTEIIQMCSRGCEIELNLKISYDITKLDKLEGHQISQRTKIEKVKYQGKSKAFF